MNGTLSFVLTVATVAGIFAILATALNVQYGFAGMANFGLAGFYAFGAFVTALAMAPPARSGDSYVLGLGLAWPVAAAIGVAATAGFGVVVGFPALRARMDEAALAITTLAVSLLLVLVLTSYDGIANGFNGVRGLSQPFSHSVEGVWTDGYVAFFLGLVVLALLACTFVVRRVSRAPVGRVLRAIREDPSVAAALGHSVVGAQLRAFVLGAAICGLAGSLWAVYARSVAPQVFSPDVTFLAWAAVIVGGVGSVWGPIFGGAVVVGLIYEGSRFLPQIMGDATPSLRGILIGLLLIVVLRFRPQGLQPERLRRFGRPAARSELASADARVAR